VRDLSCGFCSVMVLQNCVDSLRSGPVSCSETCLRSSDDRNEIIDIKVEEATDIKQEELPEPIQFRTIKTETEVSFVSSF
jgi:hypothetical protein